MKILNVITQNNQVKFEIETDSDTWKKAQDDAVNSLAKKVKVNGFRQGKVPLEMAKSHISQSEIFNKALEKIIDTQLEELEKSNEYKKLDKTVIPYVDLEINEISNDKLVLFFKYDEYPTVVQLPDYKNFNIDKKDVNVTDDQINKELDRLIRQHKKIIDKETGSLQKGDIAVFDFTGYMNNEQFSGGNAKNYELEIGSNQFIPGFEDGMVGMQLNETRRIKLKFPEDYHSKEFAGKDVEFDVTLNAMKSVQVPEVNDKFIESLDLKNIKTLSEYKENVKKHLLEANEANYYYNASKTVNDQIVKESKISYFPNKLIEKEFKQAKDNYINDLKQKGISLADYLKHLNKSEDELDFEIQKDVKERFVILLVLDEIAEKEKITASDADVMDYITKVCKIYGGNPEEIRKKMNESEVEKVVTLLTHEKTIRRIIDLSAKNEIKNDDAKKSTKNQKQTSNNSEKETKPKKSSCGSKKTTSSSTTKK